MAPQPDLFTRIIKRLESFPPVITLAAFFVFGLLLVLGSFVAGLNVVTDHSTGKTYGFIYEINWGLNFVVFVPLALYFCTATLNSVHQTIIKMADCQMIVTQEGNALDRLELSARWHEYGRRAIQVWMVLSVVVLIAVAAEWWHSCISPLHLDIPHAIAYRMPIPGWTLAPYLSGSEISPVVTATFGAFAYLGETILASCFILFISVMFAFAAWVFGFTNEDVPTELFPNPRTDDLRRGFGSFQLLIENLLVASATLFFVFFMTRLQFAFIDSRSARTVMDFVAGDIWIGFFKGVKALKDASPELFTTGSHLWYSTAMVGAATALTLITSFLIPGTIVRQAALRARDRFLDWAPAHPNEVHTLYSMTPEEVMVRMKDMAFWPIFYPGPVQLPLFVALAAGCFVFYKLTLILAGVVLYSGVRQVVKVFTH